MHLLSHRFSYYGLQLWFPEYFKRILQDECNSAAAQFTNYSNCSNKTNLQFYQDTLYTALASLPGNIAGALLINIIGGRIQLGKVSSLSQATECSVECVFRSSYTLPNILGKVQPSLQLSCLGDGVGLRGLHWYSLVLVVAKVFMI